MNKMKSIYAIFMSLILLLACNDDFLDIKNPNEYDTGTFFNTEDELELATNAVYAGLYFNGLWIREYYFIFDLLGNDASVATALQGELAQFAKYTYDPAHGHINGYWRSLYRIILRANLVLDKGQEFIDREGDNAKVERFMAEAKWLRAYAYFELAVQFGRVPIKMSTSDLDVILTPRGELTEIWGIVETDLTEAATALPDSYGPEDLGRATKGAAYALLGKTYLFQEKFSEAETEFEKLENMGYDLLPGDDWMDNWTDEDAKENNIESVFEVQMKFIPGSNTWYMFGGQEETWALGSAHNGRPMEYGFNDWQNVYTSQAAVDGFQYQDESGNDYIDPRAELTFYGRYGLGDSIWCDECGLGINDVAGDSASIEWQYNNYQTPLLYNWEQRGYRFKKYQNYEKIYKENVPESSNNGKVIRYADVLLMLAEAKLRKGSPDVSGAMAIINRVRSRIGAFQYTGSYSATEALDLLKRERHLELCGEQVRWRDLVRWGDAEIVLNQELNKQYNLDTEGNQLPNDKIFFQPKHVLFPIPQSEKDVNFVIVDDIQNGWN